MSWDKVSAAVYNQVYSECSLETNSGYIYILLISIDFYNMSIIYYSKVITFTWYSCSKIDNGKSSHIFSGPVGLILQR